MKKLFLSLILLVVSGCLYQPPLIISQPPGPGNTVVAPVEPGVVGAMPPAQKRVWRPDPTAGFIQNTSRNVFMRIWIDSRPPSPPALELGPEETSAVNLFLGSHYIYAEGRIYLPAYSRWVSVGTTSYRIDIRNWSYGYGAAWRINIGDGDFPR